MLVTAGPTREAIDPVRYISNRSSGKMGYALANAAHAMGAYVTLVSGPVGNVLRAAEGINIVNVESAGEMYEAVMRCRGGADIIIACAAVADYTPVLVSGLKLKKQEELTIELKKTKDILGALGREKSAYHVGFAAETHDLLHYAKGKLEAKNLDMIVANDVSRDDTGFDSSHNAVTIIKKNGGMREIEKDTKENIAQAILSEIASDLGE